MAWVARTKEENTPRVSLDIYLVGWSYSRTLIIYIKQLKNMNIVVGHFIPCLLGILKLDQGGLLCRDVRAEVNIWAVDRFFVDRLSFLFFVSL
jgi:hypothetical protein